jgi:hypothetical protein
MRVTIVLHMNAGDFREEINLHKALKCLQAYAFCVDDGVENVN